MGAEQPFSRRAFLRSGATLVGASWLAATWPSVLAAAEAAAKAHAAHGAFKTLKPDDAADFAAIAARIIPTDGTPGATEAGAVHFFDQAFGSFMAGAAPDLEKGLAALNDKAGARFATLPPGQQDALLKGIEATPFFGTVQFLTVAGMFALPSYGGNRDQLGWKLLGFEPRHFWQPPFGHYDAAATETKS